MTPCRFSLGSDWHTVNTAVVAYGTPLVDHPARLAGTYRSGHDTMLLDAVQVADPSTSSGSPTSASTTSADACSSRPSAVAAANTIRYRMRRLLAIAADRLDGRAQDMLHRYSHRNPGLAAVWIDWLAADFQHADRPPEVCKLGRTLVRWREPVIAWHTAGVTNGPTEGADLQTSVNALSKKIKRIAHAMTNFRNWRVRVLLAAGRSDWDLLPLAPVPQ